MLFSAFQYYHTFMAKSTYKTRKISPLYAFLGHAPQIFSVSKMTIAS